jgi:flagellar biosynthesis/type III secretory pathway protein FliH
LNIELSKCRKRDDIDFTNPLDRWIKFLIDPLYVKKLSIESTFEYPNLKKAVKLLDESNYTNGQLFAYVNYLASELSWNSTMIKQFDDGRAEGKEEGIAEGIAKGKEEGIAEGIAKGKAKVKEEEWEKILGIIMDLKSGMPADEVARKYDVEMELVLTLK